MRVLFFNPEQYVAFEGEPSNNELRLPILESGAVTTCIDFIYQRVLRAEGYEAMNRRAVEVARKVRPDVLINSTTWWQENISAPALAAIGAMGIPVYSHIWDGQVVTQPYEVALFQNSTYLGCGDSVTNYLRYRWAAELRGTPLGVLFTAGHNVRTGIFRKEEREKDLGVVVLGSNESQRIALIDFLKDELGPRGIPFNKRGGLLDNSKGGDINSDKWVPLGEYVEIINRSRMCISSQTSPSRVQLKGKIFEFLACGTLCLADLNSENLWAIPQECVAFYDNHEHLLQRILELWEYPARGEEIAKRGHEWFLASFDYKRFWSSFLQAAKSFSRELPVLPHIDELYLRYGERARSRAMGENVSP